MINRHQSPAVARLADIYGCMLMTKGVAVVEVQQVLVSSSQYIQSVPWLGPRPGRGFTGGVSFTFTSWYG